MEPVLIVTDAQGVDQAAVQSFTMDLAYGMDEQDFEIAFESPVLSGGEFVYIDGTPYGGVVDVVETESNNTISTYKGRTWHGILAGKIIAPGYTEDYVTVTGDANACIGTILARVGLTGPYAARSTASGIQVNGYRFARFVNAYDGLAAMLAVSGAKLMLERRAGVVEVWAEPIATIADEADSDLLQFVLSVNHRVPNHLVCAGEGELGERVRLDLYADAAGNISTTQTLFGVDEIAVYYDYSGADSATLMADGTKTLREMQVQGNVDTDVAGVGDWAVGDVIEARDNRVGRTVSAQIVKKIVRVDRGALTVEYEVGLPAGTSTRIQTSAEGGGGGVVYTAGDGIKIASGVISADVTQPELDAVSAVAAAAVSTVTGAAPITATRSGKTVTIGHALSGVVADKYGPNADLVPAFGDTVTIPPQIAMDQEGHITIANERTLTIPATEATQTKAGLMSAADKIKLDQGIGDALTKAEADTYYQPIGDYPTGSEVAAAIAASHAVKGTTLNLTTTNLGGGTKTLYLRRTGNVVMCSFTNTLTPSAASTVYTIGTIPTGYRPALRVTANSLGISNNAFANRWARWSFLANGSVQFVASGTTVTEYYMASTWITSDAMPR